VVGVDLVKAGEGDPEGKMVSLRKKVVLKYIYQNNTLREGGNPQGITKEEGADGLTEGTTQKN